MKPTVRRGHAKARSPLSPMARCRVLRRRTTTATARAIPITAALTVRRNVPTETRRATAMAAIRSRALTIHLPRAPIRRRGHIPHRAAATPPRRDPTPPLALAMVEAEAAVPAEAVVEAAEARAVVEAAEARTAAEAAEGRTAAEAPALTRSTNLFAKTLARPDLPDGLSVFR